MKKTDTDNVKLGAGRREALQQIAEDGRAPIEVGWAIVKRVRGTKFISPAIVKDCVQQKLLEFNEDSSVVTITDLARRYLGIAGGALATPKSKLKGRRRKTT